MKVGETFAAGQPATNLANFGSGQTSKASGVLAHRGEPSKGSEPVGFRHQVSRLGAALRCPDRQRLSNTASARLRRAHLLLESSDSARRSRNRPIGRGSRHLRFGGDGAPLSASAGWWGANGAIATLRKEGRDNDAGRQDLRSSAKDLEERQSPGRSGSRTPATAGARHQTLRRSKASKPTLPVLPPRQSRSQQWNRPKRGGDRGRTARGQRPQRCGTAVGRGILRGVRILHRGKALKRPGLRPGEQRGNAENPRIGSGMQQARDSSSGGNRRGGEKPRGRNRTSKVEPSRPKGWQAAIPGVDAERACRWRGDRHISQRACCDVWTEPRREGRKTRANGKALKRSEGEEVCIERFFREPPERAGSGTPRGPGWQRLKVEEGAGRPTTRYAARTGQRLSSQGENPATDLERQ